MNIPPEAFVSHFKPVFQVHCLKLWRQRSLPRCLHEWIKTEPTGHMDIDLAAFRVNAWLVIDELQRKGKGARPPHRRNSRERSTTLSA
jgi:hypothetical protein